MKVITKLAIFIFAMNVFANIQIAKAGPISYSVCLAACLPFVESPPLLGLCIAACTPLLKAPTP